MISICIAGCLKRPERLDYLRQNMNSLLKHFPGADYLIGLDNTTDEAGDLVRKEYPMARVKTHTLGFGHSWNWAIQEAKYDFILQTEEDWLCTCCWSSDKDKDIVQKVEYGVEKCKQDNGILLKLDNGMGIGSPPKSPYRPGWRDYEKCPKTGKQVYELNRPELRAWYEGWNPYYMSNHPHLKHKRFHELVGFYAEKAALLAMIRQHVKDPVKADLAVVPHTELDMCKKVIFSPKTKMLFYNNNSFVHIGHESVREY